MRRHYDFAPVERQLTLAGLTTATQIAECLGTTTRTFYRWRELGLSPATADAVARHLGLHPVLVWPDWFEDVAAA